MKSLTNTINLGAIIGSIIAVFLGACWLWFRSSWKNAKSPRLNIPQWIFATMGASVLLISLGSWWERVQASKIYQIDVRVRAAPNEPSSNIRVWTSVGGEGAQTDDGRWVFKIPAASMPSDSLTIYASSDKGFLVGSATVKPGISSYLLVDLSLSKQQESIINGVVIDQSGKPISDARITLPSSQEVRTTAAGNFTITIPEKPGVSIHFMVQQAGYQILDVDVLLRDEPVVLVLQRIPRGPGL